MCSFWTSSTQRGIWRDTICWWSDNSKKRSIRDSKIYSFGRSSMIVFRIGRPTRWAARRRCPCRVRAAWCTLIACATWGCISLKTAHRRCECCGLICTFRPPPIGYTRDRRTQVSNLRGPRAVANEPWGNGSAEWIPRSHGWEESHWKLAGRGLPWTCVCLALWYRGEKASGYATVIRRLDLLICLSLFWHKAPSPVLLSWLIQVHSFQTGLCVCWWLTGGVAVSMVFFNKAVLSVYDFKVSGNSEYALFLIF